jgi:hypothetical protein
MEDLKSMRSVKGTEPLQDPLTSSHEAVVQTLLDAGANINKESILQYCSALEATSICGHGVVVRVVLNTAPTSMHRAELHGDAL